MTDMFTKFSYRISISFYDINLYNDIFWCDNNIALAQYYTDTDTSSLWVTTFYFVNEADLLMFKLAMKSQII